VLRFQYTDEKGLKSTESWEAYTNAYNYKYLYCKDKETVAYYYCDKDMFYFTAFYGSKKSLLYYFYLSAYKVYLGENETAVQDELPFNILRNNWLTRSLNDFIAPVFNRIKVRFSGQRSSLRPKAGTNEITIHSKINLCFGQKSKNISESIVTVRINGLESFTYTQGTHKIEARCES